jgi:16S rRNA (adenine1518-N6/adenine1519-N6)-dimethyltransferase
MKLSAIKQILVEDGIKLTRSLGQSFLHDANQLRRIVEAAELTERDRVLEVGPGLGPLTELLVERGCPVLAIEKDERLVRVLRRRFRLEVEPGARPSRGATPRGESEASGTDPAGKAEDERPAPGLRLLHDDALRFLKSEPRDWRGWKLVANLPYSVASPILVELALAEMGPERLVATVQLEVAKRLMARAGGKDYGVLTLLVGLEYEPGGWFKIPAGCFFPKPGVDAACVCLVRRARRMVRPEHKLTFISLVKRGFSQRRKRMQKLLRADWPEDKLLRAFDELGRLGLPVDARAEAATLEHFVRLTELLEGDSAHG